MQARSQATVDVSLPQGTFRGTAGDEVMVFRGVPYAAPPVGMLRFAPPQTPKRMTGVQDATRFGPTVSTPPQRSAVIDSLLPDPVRPGVSGLNLNIWTSRLDGVQPVLVWIHGGGFVTGAGSTTVFDGSSFARGGIVVVTINYRLAVEGFATLPGTVANRGLLDQLAALRWVRDHISFFGGDPGRVTVAGQSAGAMSVLTLLAMPAASGLMQRVISQSGDGHHVHTSAAENLLVQALGEELDVDPTPAELMRVPPAALHRATNATIARVTAGTDDRFATFTRLGFQPVIDAMTLPLHPLVAVREGVGREVDVLLGWNAQEYGLFSAPTGLARSMTEDMLVRSINRIGVDAAAILRGYRKHLKAASLVELFVAIQSDWFCRVSTIRYAEARNAAAAPAHVYEFAWQPNTFSGALGACHTLEIPFVFDSLADPWGRQLRGADAPQSLATDMHQTWARFIKTGDPGWPAYEGDRLVQQIGLENTLTTDPQPWRRSQWETLI